MDVFKAWPGRAESIVISQESYMGCTGGVAPWRRDGDTGPSYYAVCPLCDNPIQIVGLFRRQEESRARPQGERRAHVRRGEGGIMTAQAPCAKIARRDPDLADRMWATITVGGREVVDAEKRALGRRVCETCPLRTTCIADSLVGGWKDRNLIGGLDYRRRTVLSKLVCRDLGITARQLHDMPAQRVSDWLERHPDWADRTRLADSSDWRQRKRLQRRKRERLSVAPSSTDAASVPPAIQGVLF